MASQSTDPQTDKTSLDYSRLTSLAYNLLEAIGEDPQREGLIGTPRRFAKWWQEFIEYHPGKLDTTFDAVQVNQMVVVRGIEVWSLCEHHLLPFSMSVDIGYLTENKVLGLSKLARICHLYAHRLQIQERFVQDVANEISQLADTTSVAVIAKGQHLCMAMRGIKSEATMVTSVMTGAFLQEVSTRQEFLYLTRVTDGTR